MGEARRGSRAVDPIPRRREGARTLDLRRRPSARSSSARSSLPAAEGAARKNHHQQQQPPGAPMGEQQQQQLPCRIAPGTAVLRQRQRRGVGR
ncbi:hypothetical protein MTO96_024835 [Rhipicephalus appendiculatus]